MLNSEFSHESMHFFSFLGNVQNSNIEKRVMPSRTSKTRNRHESAPAASTSRDVDDDLGSTVSDEEQSEQPGPLGKRTETNCVKVRYKSLFYVSKLFHDNMFNNKYIPFISLQRQRVVRWNENKVRNSFNS